LSAAGSLFNAGLQILRSRGGICQQRINEQKITIALVWLKKNYIFVSQLVSMNSGKLTLPEKLNLLMDRGVLMKSITHDSAKVNLYVMDGKYYEVWFDSGGIVDKIKEMNLESVVHQYLDKD
jgi:hypothetical protein